MLSSAYATIVVQSSEEITVPFTQGELQRAGCALTTNRANAQEIGGA